MFFSKKVVVTGFLAMMVWLCMHAGVYAAIAVNVPEIETFYPAASNRYTSVLQIPIETEILNPLTKPIVQTSIVLTDQHFPEGCNPCDPQDSCFNPENPVCGGVPCNPCDPQDGCFNPDNPVCGGVPCNPCDPQDSCFNPENSVCGGVPCNPCDPQDGCFNPDNPVCGDVP